MGSKETLVPSAMRTFLEKYQQQIFFLAKECHLNKGTKFHLAHRHCVMTGMLVETICSLSGVEPATATYITTNALFHDWEKQFQVTKKPVPKQVRVRAQRLGIDFNLVAYTECFPKEEDIIDPILALAVPILCYADAICLHNIIVTPATRIEGTKARYQLCDEDWDAHTKHGLYNQEKVFDLLSQSSARVQERTSVPLPQDPHLLPFFLVQTMYELGYLPQSLSQYMKNLIPPQEK